MKREHTSSAAIVIPTPKVWCPLSTDFYDVINIGKQPTSSGNIQFVDGSAYLSALNDVIGFYANVSSQAYYGIFNVMKAMTISFKIKIVNNSRTNPICDWAPINSSSYHVKLNWQNGTLSLQQGSRTSSTVSLSSDIWHTITWTYIGTTIKLYIDGVLAITYTTSSNSSSSSANFIRPGRTSWSSSSNYITGYYKDFRVWDYVLDDNIIAAL